MLTYHVEYRYKGQATTHKHSCNSEQAAVVYYNRVAAAQITSANKLAKMHIIETSGGVEKKIKTYIPLHKQY